MTRAKLEYVAVAAMSAALLLLLLPAMLHARADTRDDLRRTDLANLKRAAEMYFNQHAFYPTPAAGQAACTKGDDANSWLFGNESPLLKEQHIDAIPHDVREGRGHAYQYCVTDTVDNAAAGYYFQAQLEVDQPDTVDHDYDESRNYDYRVLHEDGQTLYRVCGGTEPQCTPA